MSVRVTDARIVVKESAADVIVETGEGSKASLPNMSPIVEKGDKGIILEIDGKEMFVREPYDGGWP